MKTIYYCLLLFILLPLTASAQKDSVVSMTDDLSLSLPSSVRPMHPLADKSKLTDTLQKWEFHLSMGGEFVGNRWGSASLYGITPTIIYRPSDRLKIRTSVSMLNSYSLMPQGYSIRGREPRSLAPLRHPNAAAALDISATYKVNDRLWLSASLLRLGGSLASGMIVNPWLMGFGPVTLDATAFSAAMRYRMGEDSYIDLQMTVIDDRTGALWPTMMDPFCSPFHYHSTVFGGHLF